MELPPHAPRDDSKCLGKAPTVWGGTEARASSPSQGTGPHGPYRPPNTAPLQDYTLRGMDRAGTASPKPALVLLFLQHLLPALLETGSWVGWTSVPPLRSRGPSSAFKTHSCVEEPNGSHKPLATQTTDWKTLAASCLVALEIFFPGTHCFPGYFIMFPVYWYTESTGPACFRCTYSAVFSLAH